MRIVQYMVGCERAQEIQWCLNYIHSMKYAEVINASIAANSAGIDYSYYMYVFPNTLVKKTFKNTKHFDCSTAVLFSGDAV